MSLRDDNKKRLTQSVFDVLIVGGGINGAVSAAALAAKGLKVALIDQGDFAGETSSHSSNLVWGGIKYLESHEYRLVSKLCKSRNHLAASYPATVKEIRFLTTIQKGFRLPAFLVYLGTLFYWILGRFYTQAPSYLSPKKIKSMEPIIDISNAQGGFEYSDCYLFDNDARFVFNFIRASMDRGAAAVNYVNALAGNFDRELWTISAVDIINNEPFEVKAKSVINACGPFADGFNDRVRQKTAHHHVFSKGIHLIVDRLTKNNKVLAFFAADGRLFFVIPMGPKTCIGTTDTKVDSPDTHVTKEDRQFVLSNVNAMLDLDHPLSEKDIIAERCGVRPLAVVGADKQTDWVQLSRKHAIDVNIAQRYLSIFGGKLTDCINVGEEVVDTIACFGIEFPARSTQWYGEADASVRDQFYAKAQQMNLDALSRTDIHERLSDRFWRRYGAKALPMLDEIARDAAQADIVIADTEYRRCELRYIAKHEMITKLDDFLRRRSKIALIKTPDWLRTRGHLLPACKILFGEEAEAKLNEYLVAVAEV